ncbi:primosomal protein N' (replication factor Y) - superfamily II helicase [Roseobacter sp. HKCCA0434]|uniref:primosomal protein N' (replication factor Y) - superfamily II helicase n=1 Tax=Roseobacter sp. HKCCA0434 TaxID=3079297 RepID=UPI002905B119|nr:primosomal protein N' (replication factor Y) - superfamily II helicase [Roseobacter sp. HKCCA0434]
MAEIETHRFPCGTCGSDLRYAAGERLLRCDHCGAEQALGRPSPWDQASVAELSFAQAIAQEIPESAMEETRVVSCTSCGAQVEFDRDEHSAECPFCASPVVTDTGTHRHIKPRGVLPFLIDHGGGRDALRRWLKGLWFAPNALKDYARSDERMQGIYMPFWTFDAQADASYRGQRGTVHTRTVGHGDNRRTVSETRWRPVSGRISHFFDDMLVRGSNTLPEDHVRRIENFDLTALEPYRPEFLAGFRAEGYSIDLPTARIAADQAFDAGMRQLVRRDIGGDKQRIDRLDMQLSNVTFKHVLLPVWIAAYRFRGKSYRFVVNARTGEVAGERPYSPWKIAFAVILGLIAAGIFAYFYTR